jgi:hypothetical protein
MTADLGASGASAAGAAVLSVGARGVSVARVGVPSLKRLASGISRIGLVPVANALLAVLPTEVYLTVSAPMGEIDQPTFDVFEHDPPVL